MLLFAIDDSEIQIEDRSHTILAAIGIQESSTLESALDRLKLQFGLTPADEVKWNGMKPMPQIASEALSQELMTLLHKSIPLVVINEGRSKQTAAERIAVQIADLVRKSPWLVSAEEPVELMFDEGILDDEPKYAQSLHTLIPSPVASASITIVRSHESAAIQHCPRIANHSSFTQPIFGFDLGQPVYNHSHSNTTREKAWTQQRFLANWKKNGTG